MIYDVNIVMYKLEWFNECTHLYVIFPLTVKIYINRANASNLC